MASLHPYASPHTTIASSTLDAARVEGPGPSLPIRLPLDRFHPPLDHALDRTSRAFRDLPASLLGRLVHFLAALVQRVNVVGAFLLVVVGPGQAGLDGAGWQSAAGTGESCKNVPAC